MRDLLLENSTNKYLIAGEQTPGKDGKEFETKEFGERSDRGSPGACSQGSISRQKQALLVDY